MALSQVLLRILRDRPPEVVERAVSAVAVEDLSARHELLLLVGHREGAGSRLVSEAFADSMERQLGQDVLASPAVALGKQRELARLLALAADSDGAAFEERIEQWTENVGLLMHLLRSVVLESVGHTVGRADVHRGYQLNWPALQKLVGEGLLARRVLEHDAAVQPLLTDDVMRGAWGQALRYASDPDAALVDMKRWGGIAGDDEDQEP